MPVIKAVTAALLLSVGLVIAPSAQSRVEAQTPPNEVGCNTFDASGDAQDLGTTNARPEPRADITQVCVSYGYSLRVAVVIAQPTDPSGDPGWGAGGDSRLEVGIDTDDDPDFELGLGADGEVFAGVSTAPDGPPICAAPFYVLPTGYAVEISRNCLGTDTVAVSVQMVYDPAPAPTAGPLVADLAPDAGFVPRVTRAAPAVPQPLADAAPQVCVADEENDTVDEAFQPVVFDIADITQTCAQHGATEIRLTARMRRATDPQVEPLWRAGTVVAWELDTNNDLDHDFTVTFSDTGTRAEPEDATEFADTCAGTPGFDGTILVVHIPRTCVGNPQYFAQRPSAVFARVNQLEPQPPLALDIFRFPGFSPLVGAPGVTVPAQTTPSGGTPAAPSDPATPGTAGGVGNTVTTTAPPTTLGTTGGTASSGGSSAGATVSQTAARSSNLASTGATLDPAVWALGLLGAGMVFVLLSRRRAAVEAAGQWDLLPSRGRDSTWRGRSRG